MELLAPAFLAAVYSGVLSLSALVLVLILFTLIHCIAGNVQERRLRARRLRYADLVEELVLGVLAPGDCARHVPHRDRLVVEGMALEYASKAA